MKLSDFLFSAKAHFHDLIVEALSELYDEVMERAPELTEINLTEFAEKGVCERVGTFIMCNDGETGEWGTFDYISKGENGKLYLTAEGTDTERTDEAYGFYAEELVYVYDELEKIYESLA